MSLTLRSILAKPSALDALSLASWNSSLRDRLVSMTDRLQGPKSSKLKPPKNINKRLKQKCNIPLIFLLPDLVRGRAVICTFPEFIPTFLQANIEELSGGLEQHSSDITATWLDMLGFIKDTRNILDLLCSDF